MLDRLTRFALLLLIGAYVPFVLACAATIGFGAYWLTRFALGLDARPRAFVAVALSLDLVVLGLIFALLVGLLPLLFRNPSEPLDEFLLKPAHHPRLFALLGRICKRLRCRPPDVVALIPGEQTSIGDIDFRRPDGSLEHRRRTLILGAALVIHLRADEFATVLCHEIAHAAGGDTRLSRFADRFFRSLSTQLGLLKPDRDSPWLQIVLNSVLWAYFFLFVLVYGADSRRRERRADRLAAEICGPQNLRNALIKTHLAAYIPELGMDSLIGEFAIGEQEAANIYREYRRRWDTLPVARRMDAENHMFMQRPSLFSTHPVLADRIRALRGLDAREWTLDKPATSLFGDWELLEVHMTQLLIPRLRAAFNQYLRDLDREARAGR